MARVMLCVLAALFVVGTFFDLQIDRLLYAKDNPVVVVLSTMGLLPMMFPACVMLGAIM